MRLEGSTDEGGLMNTWSTNESTPSRIRLVTLTRRKGVSFGFHLRGGREHGTGFFISHVEPNSEAALQGLRAGDQVLRVNQMTVEGAVHKEVAAMVQGSSTVVLQVKGAGIIPIKDSSRSRYLSKQKLHSSTSLGRHRRRGDPLTWLMVEDDPYAVDPSSQSLHGGTSLVGSELEYISTPRHQDGSGYLPTGGSQGSESPNGASLVSERIVINVGKDGLGCSICKGPPEKPGIYVQSVKAGGVARESGLRAGDLVLACNNTPFTKLQFKEAVFVLKSSNRLVLDVVHGAGLELVTGESSGYNSSASSIAGDQTPPSGMSVSSVDHQRTYPCQDSITHRLSAVSKHLQLDTNRGWKEIETEWANAEAEEKRRQLHYNQKLLKSQKQRNALHSATLNNGSISGSQSLSNLLQHHNEDYEDEDEDEACTVFREGPTTKLDRHKARKYNTVLHKPLLRSTRSTNDVRTQSSGNHKIALVTSRDPHVNNIVIREGPKSEQDALSRLDQLSSSASSSRLDSTSSATSVSSIPNHNLSSSVSRLENLTNASQMTSSKECLHRKSLSVALEDAAMDVEEKMRRLRLEQQRLEEEAERLQEERRIFEEEKRGLLRTHSVPLAPLVIQCSGPPVLSSPSPTPSNSSVRHTSKILIRSSPPAPPPRDVSTALSGKLKRSQRSEHRLTQGHNNNFCHHQNNQLHNHSPPSSPSASIASSSGVASSCSSYGGALPRRCKSIGSLSESSGEGTIWEDCSNDQSTSSRLYSTQQLNKTGLSSSSSTLISLDLYDDSANNNTLQYSLSRQVVSNSPSRQLVPPPPTLPKPCKGSPSNFPSTAINPSLPYEKAQPCTSVSSGAPPPPPLPPAPASRNSSSLASALNNELERRTSKEARGTVSEEARARAIEDKIHNYKKEKKAQSQYNPLKAQHDQLMEEFKMAHQRMFSGKDDHRDDDDQMKANPLREHHGDIDKSKQSSVSTSSPKLDFLTKKHPTKTPKPPETYFSDSSKKTLVLIESYPDPSQRPQPRKMDFLQSLSPIQAKELTDMPNRDDLQNELSNTLKRSNLRQRYTPQDKTQQSQNQCSLPGATNGDQHGGPSSLSEKYQSLGIQDKKPSDVHG